ncbi:MAG: hypothetical protein M0T71_12740 [Actinomycetota bacterium]|nr:hypothetical protein [Actinomycetota bacterium]
MGRWRALMARQRRLARPRRLAARWRRLAARWTAARTARAVTGDCEAYLAGTFAERAARERSSVPAWALLNSVAHGDLEQIRAAAAGRGPRLAALPLGWAHASRQLAGEVAAYVGDDEARLSALQLSVLIPYELELIREHGDGGDLRIAVAWARAALHSVGG